MAKLFFTQFSCESFCPGLMEVFSQIGALRGVTGDLQQPTHALRLCIAFKNHGLRFGGGVFKGEPCSNHMEYSLPGLYIHVLCGYKLPNQKRGCKVQPCFVTDLLEKKATGALAPWERGKWTCRFIVKNGTRSGLRPQSCFHLDVFFEVRKPKIDSDNDLFSVILI